LEPSHVTFDLASFINLAINVLASFGAVAIFYFGLKGEARSLRESHDAMTHALEEHKKSTNDRFDELSRDMNAISDSKVAREEWIEFKEMRHHQLARIEQEQAALRAEDMNLRQRVHDVSDRVQTILFDVLRKRGGGDG
jgi:hypothetical protein